MPRPLLPLSAIRQAAFFYGPDLAVVETNDLAEALAGQPLAGCSAEAVARIFRARGADGTPLGPGRLRSSRALCGEDVLEVPLSVTTADGQALEVLATASPVRDGDATLGVLVLWQDVTGRRAAERTLADEHELLERLIETVPVMISIHDPALGRFHLNRAVEEILGYTDEDAADGRLLERTYPDPAYRATVEAFMRSLEPGWRDMIVTARDGSAVPTAWANFRLSNEVEVGVGIDLRERTRMEAALRESEADARSFMANMIDAVAICEPVVDAAGEPVDIRVVEVNPAFLDRVPLAADEVAGRTVSAILPGMDRAWFDRFLDVARSGSPVTVEEPFPAFGRWYRVAAFPVRGGRIAVVFDDITGQHEAEAALRQYAENLQRSNEDLERFAYVASHDLQEPLRSIVSFTQLLERRYRGRLDADADEYIEFIVTGGTRMQGLIQDLLAFSRVNTTRQQIARTDAEDVLAEAERGLDAPLREAEATLTHDPLPVVMADPTQLAQVFANLVSNAIKFRKPDEPLRIHISARRLDGVWEFSVRDNGIGIEAEYFETIFVIFQRLHTKEAYPGTGIGLAIVKRIIDRHGGTVRVESTPGQGSTFVFTLPGA